MGTMGAKEEDSRAGVRGRLSRDTACKSSRGTQRKAVKPLLAPQLPARLGAGGTVRQRWRPFRFDAMEFYGYAWARSTACKPSRGTPIHSILIPGHPAHGLQVKPWHPVQQNVGKVKKRKAVKPIAWRLSCRRGSE
jgi:hypothetical protein